MRIDVVQRLRKIYCLRLHSKINVFRAIIAANAALNLTPVKTLFGQYRISWHATKNSRAAAFCVERAAY